MQTQRPTNLKDADNGVYDDNGFDPSKPLVTRPRGSAIILDPLNQSASPKVGEQKAQLKPISPNQGSQQPQTIPAVKEIKTPLRIKPSTMIVPEQDRKDLYNRLRASRDRLLAANQAEQDKLDALIPWNDKSSTVRPFLELKFIAGATKTAENKEGGGIDAYKIQDEYIRFFTKDEDDIDNPSLSTQKSEEFQSKMEKFQTDLLRTEYQRIDRYYHEKRIKLDLKLQNLKKIVELKENQAQISELNKLIHLQLQQFDDEINKLNLELKPFYDELEQIRLAKAKEIESIDKQLMLCTSSTNELDKPENVQNGNHVLSLQINPNIDHIKANINRILVKRNEILNKRDKFEKNEKAKLANLLEIKRKLLVAVKWNEEDCHKVQAEIAAIDKEIDSEKKMSNAIITGLYNQFRDLYLTYGNDKGEKNAKIYHKFTVQRNKERDAFKKHLKERANVLGRKETQQTETNYKLREYLALLDICVKAEWTQEEYQEIKSYLKRVEENRVVLGFAPIHFACKFYDLEFAKLLPPCEDPLRLNPVEIILKREHRDTVEFINFLNPQIKEIKNYLKIAVENSNYIAFHVLMKTIKANKLNNEFHTFLFYELFTMACEKGNRPIVIELILMMREHDFRDMRVIFQACLHAYTQGHADVAKILFEGGFVMPTNDNYPRTKDNSSPKIVSPTKKQEEHGSQIELPTLDRSPTHDTVPEVKEQLPKEPQGDLDKPDLQSTQEANKILYWQAIADQAALAIQASREKIAKSQLAVASNARRFSWANLPVNGANGTLFYHSNLSPQDKGKNAVVSDSKRTPK